MRVILLSWSQPCTSEYDRVLIYLDNDKHGLTEWLLQNYNTTQPVLDIAPWRYVSSQVISAVPAVYPPKLLPNSSLLLGMGNRESLDTMQALFSNT